MGLLRLPEPYDFELSTGRYRAFGTDLANLWLDGALHRVVGRREVRIAAARGGGRGEPLDAETRPGVLTLLGAALRGGGGGGVRVAGAGGGVGGEPLDAETRPVVLTLLGAEFDLDSFYDW